MMNSIKAVVSGALVAMTGAWIGAASQQTPPATEVYLAPIVSAGGSSRLASWINISNDADYDNQPSFLPDSSAVLFTSRRDGTQTDIYRYDIAGKSLTQVTRTPESEYSPTMTPDRRTFSVIRVEADNAQRLWRFDLDGANPRVILESVKPVGYHAWIDDTRLALFVLGSPATLQIADAKTGLATIAATGIGRSVLVRPGRGTVSYLATGETPRVLKEFDVKTGASATITMPVPGSQDAAWTPEGMLLMANGMTIHSWTPGSTTWANFATLSDVDKRGESQPPPAVTSITRMAVSPDGRWMAFVAEPVARTP
jgi:hypothetical protein